MRPGRVPRLWLSLRVASGVVSCGNGGHSNLGSGGGAGPGIGGSSSGGPGGTSAGHHDHSPGFQFFVDAGIGATGPWGPDVTPNPVMGKLVNPSVNAGEPGFTL